MAHMTTMLKYGFSIRSCSCMPPCFQALKASAPESSHKPRMQTYFQPASANVPGLRFSCNLRLLCRREYDCLRLHLRPMRKTWEWVGWRAGHYIRARRCTTDVGIVFAFLHTGFFQSCSGTNFYRDRSAFAYDQTHTHQKLRADEQQKLPSLVAYSKGTGAYFTQIRIQHVEVRPIKLDHSLYTSKQLAPASWLHVPENTMTCTPLSLPMESPPNHTG